VIENSASVGPQEAIARVTRIVTKRPRERQDDTPA